MSDRAARDLVVHVRAGAYDVYVGRGRCPLTGRPGAWGNPYSHKPGTCATHRVACVQDAVEAYRRWLWTRLRSDEGPALTAALAALHGRTLGCWCRPGPCHGDVLVSAAAWAHRARNELTPAG